MKFAAFRGLLRWCRSLGVSLYPKHSGMASKALLVQANEAITLIVEFRNMVESENKSACQKQAPK